VSETDRLDIQMNGNFIEKAVLGFADLINWVKDVVTWFVHLDEHVENGARAVRGFIDDIKTWAKDAAKAASDMVTAVANAIASLPSKMFEAGKNIWRGLVNGIKSGIETAKGAAANLAKAIIDKFTTDTEIHSPSALFERFGKFIDQGLANGIASAIPYVTTAMQGVVDAVQEKGNELIAAGSTQATNYVTGFLSGLDTQWQQIDSSLQNDFLGSMKTLGTAIEKGDLQSLGKWAASYFYHAMDDEQRKQIKSIANNSLQWLTQGLSSVWNNIAGMASSFIGQLVPSTVAATTAQTGLNIAMDANPILFVVSLIAMLAGALLNLAGTNSDVAGGISSVWGGLKDFMSYIFEGIVRLLGTFVQGFINGVNIMIGAYNLVAQLWGGQIDYIKNPLFEYADKIAAARENSSSVDSLASGNVDYSNVPGTSQYSEATSSGSYTSSYSRSAELTPSELRDSVKEGFIAAMRESGFGDTDNGNFTVRVYLDGKEITSAVEKRQSDRGMSLMGTEAYSY
jgi:phage-related protein